MIKASTIGWSLLAVSLAAGAAQALELTNRDKVAHRLVVMEGEFRQEITIAPDQTLTDVCKTDCSVWVGDDPDAYEVVATDRLLIENAQLFFIEPPAQNEETPENQRPNDENPGSGDQPSGVQPQ